MNFEQQLQHIAANVEVVSPNSYRVNGKTQKIFHKHAWTDYVGPLGQFGHNQSADTEQQKQLLESHLCNGLYARIYCGIPEGKELTNLPVLQEREAFMQTLSAANHSSDEPDQNWKIYHMDAQGTWTSKNGKLRQAHSNSYIPATPNTPLAVNQYVHFLRQKEGRHLQQVFYYVHGNHYLEHDAPQVRIYWHIKPEGAAALIELMTRVLNEHKIAFNFKCLNHPELYVRADSAVLYLEKRYFEYAIRVLKPHLESLSEYLLEDHPLFTQTIFKGVSFAEDPGNGQSFGMHRCQLLARSLLVAYEKQQASPKPSNPEQPNSQPSEASQLRLACMLEVLSSKGIDIHRLHLNPNTLILPTTLQDDHTEAA